MKMLGKKKKNESITLLEIQEFQANAALKEARKKLEDALEKLDKGNE